MSRVILAFTFALACVFCRGVTAVEPLRILSYNIHHAEGLDDKLDLPRIAEVIKSVSPDFVFLQEVDRRVLRSGQVDQATELGKLTGLHSAFGGNIRLGAGDYGNAILSRFPLRELKNHPLPNRDDGEQRGVFSAQVSLPDSLGGGTCRLLATHLDHRSSDVERLASIRMIRRLIADNTTPTILGGDFNATIDSDVMNQVRRDWTLSNQTERPTFPASHPDRQIDYIGFRPADRFQVRQVQVLDEAVASDHRPILLLLTPVGH